MNEKNKESLPVQPEKKEDVVDKLVREWIEGNPAEFTIDGKRINLTKDGELAKLTKKDENRLRFRIRTLERCKQYKDAPDEYLRKMLETLSETFKWYFDAFQTIFMTGLFGFFVTVAILTINNFLIYVQKWSSNGFPPDLSIFNFPAKFLSLVQTSFSDWIVWVLPLIIVIFIGISAIKTREVTKTSWLSHFIQHRFRIVHNLTELKIEMYYISNIIKMREAEKKQKTAETI